MTVEPIVPRYGEDCIAAIFPALLEPGRPAPWLPAAARDAKHVVLLVLDGLGWLQLDARRSIAPTLAAMQGGPVASVVPSTTSAALTSIATGVSPGRHGVIGYRVHVGGGDVLNVLRWQTAGVDALDKVRPDQFQPEPAFGGLDVPVVTKAEFHRTGFTAAMFGSRSIVGYRAPSSIAVEVRDQFASGAPFVYAYYDGVDKIAHACGFGDHYDAELAATDRLVGDIVDALPPGAVLLVTADHGQVEVGDRIVELEPGVLDGVELMSGEGRFRWLHARPGAAADVLDAASSLEASGVAWVRSAEQASADGWFGAVGEPARARMGDVAIAARADVAFRDPTDSDAWLVCRHGSLTAAEMLVPLVAASG